jgi:hypothetical protein
MISFAFLKVSAFDITQGNKKGREIPALLINHYRFNLPNYRYCISKPFCLAEKFRCHCDEPYRQISNLLLPETVQEFCATT